MQASHNAHYIDPHYRYLKLVKSIGDREKGSTASYGLAAGWTRRVAPIREEDQIPIFAKISNLEAWQQLQNVQHGINIAIDQEHWIVTARIPLNHFEELNGLPFVSHLKVTRAVYPLLNDTIKEIGLDQHAHSSHRPSIVSEELLSQGGKHVVVGIVDFGCAFAHENFRKPSGKTRIHSIWSQKLGEIYTREKINKALREQDPYSALGYHPSDDHGTHVMDIAAGSGYSKKGLSRSWPKAKIIFVDISDANTY